MKLIDEKGRIFGKINILDFIALTFVLILIILASFKILNTNLSELSEKEDLVKVQVETSVIMDKGYFEVVKVGDKLSEMKSYLDAEIIDIEIRPVEVVREDDEGNKIIEVDPEVEKAIITFEGQVPYSNNIYNFGKQELRQGKMMFLESDLYRYRVQIMNLKAVS